MAAGGDRESLESQTMDMASAAAGFLSVHLKYPDGRPIQWGIADTRIGGISEAAACTNKFMLEGVGLTLTVTP
jgi:L-fucose isomerase